MSLDARLLIRRTGPSLTTNLIAKLVAQGVNEAAARKRVQRATEHFTKLAGIRFNKNARFIYRDIDYGEPRFWRNLEEAFYTHGKSYWCAITNLRSRGGYCERERFSQVSGAPSARKGQRSPDIILERLKAINMLDEVTLGDKSYVAFDTSYHRKEPIEVINATALAEFVALNGIKEWARKLGLGSYNKFNIRGDEEPPVVSGLTFDLSAPSFVRPLMSVENGRAKPGFLACDINLLDVIEKDEVEAFVRKCDAAAFSKSIPPIMPMLVGHVFSSEGLDLAKRKGILALTLENLFGLGLSKSLRDLVKLLTNAGATAGMNPDHLMEVMTALTKIEGAQANLRGALFELVVGSLVKDVEGGYLKTGQRRRDLETGKEVEIDVQLDRDSERGFLFVECKAKNPGARVSEKDVKRWYSDRVPLIQKIMDTDYKEVRRPFHYEIWTNGIFADSALQWLKQQPKKCAGYTIDWKDGSAVKAYADKAQNSSLRKMLNEHYFKNPLTSVVQTTGTDQ